MEGLSHTGTFQYYKKALDSIGSNVHAKLEFDYCGDPQTIYFNGSVPREFRNDNKTTVYVVCEPIYIYQEFPIYYRIKCIEKID